MNNLELAMKSLFRYRFMLDNKYPNVIIENEQNILQDRLLILKIDDIKYISDNWNNYYHKQLIEEEIVNYHIITAVEHEICKLN